MGRLFDNRKARISLAALIIGSFVLVILVVIGVVLKEVIKTATKTRLEYEYPDGFKEDKNYKECWHRTEGEAKLNDEYYMWNLTNAQEVLRGENAIYKLAGPYVYANWTCDYDWQIDGDFLSYRTVASGLHFIETQSRGSRTDLITNINPGYLGLVKGAGSEQAVVALMTGGALKTIIDNFQANASIEKIQVLGFPTVLLKINDQVTTSMAAAYSLGVLNGAIAGISSSLPPNTTVNATYNILFNNPSTIVPVPGAPYPFKGFAYYVNQTTGTPPPALSLDSINLILAAWNATYPQGTGILVFAQTPLSAIMTKYGVSQQQAQLLLLYVGKYLIVPTSINPQYVTGLVYAQWANLTVLYTQIDLGGGLKGWEVGYPLKSNFTADVVMRLFDPKSNYSLASTNGIQFWFGALVGAVPYAVVQQIYPTMSLDQFNIMRFWINNFHKTVNIPLQMKQFGITDWNDFAFVQWGQLVLGQSVGPLNNLTYYPEIAAFNAAAIGKNDSCFRYNMTEAKAILTGTSGLLRNPTITALFMDLATKKQYTAIEIAFNLDANRADCMLAYLSYISKFAVLPKLMDLFAQGAGLITTRTVDDWLFNAQDPLLKILGQPYNVGLMANRTATEQQANAVGKRFLRIYTGDNDLYSSFQPPDYQSIVHGLWAEDIMVEGHNGTQFLPYDWVKKKENEERMLLWHTKVMRPVGLTYVGMTSWEGVDLAYLTLHPTALVSSKVNPGNEKYYSTYGGLINETSFITNHGLPVFLSLPSFHTADPETHEGLTLIDDIFEPIDLNDKYSTHRYQVFILVEPYLGSALWGNVPIQANFEVKPLDLFYTNIKPMFAPIYWNAYGDRATSKDMDTLKNKLIRGRKLSKTLIGVGAGAGGILMIAGAIGLIKYRNTYTKAAAAEDSKKEKEDNNKL